MDTHCFGQQLLEFKFSSISITELLTGYKKVDVLMRQGAFGKASAIKVLIRKPKNVKL